MSRHITQAEWNEFVAGRPHAEFLQSWEWGEQVYAQEKKEILRIAYPNEGEVRAVCQLIERGEGTPFHYLYAPGGPVAVSARDAEEVLDCAALELKLRQVPFLRCEPAEPFARQGMRRVRDERPSHTLILDLGSGAEALFASFHEKTRYNIRLAEKKGVTVKEVFDVGEDHPDQELFENSMKRFHALLRETAERGDFFLHPWIHYIRLVDAFCRSSAEEPLGHATPAIRFYTAWHKEHMIGGILCMVFGDTVTYLHGASSYEHRAYMAPYALQWHAILQGIEGGYSFYDLWGVAPQGADGDHPWAGFTRFKQGFGGTPISRAGTFDIVLSPVQYGLYSIARRMNRFLQRRIR